MAPYPPPDLDQPPLIGCYGCGTVLPWGYGVCPACGFPFDHAFYQEHINRWRTLRAAVRAQALMRAQATALQQQYERDLRRERRREFLNSSAEVVKAVGVGLVPVVRGAREAFRQFSFWLGIVVGSICLLIGSCGLITHPNETLSPQQNAGTGVLIIVFGSFFFFSAWLNRPPPRQR